MSIVDPYARKAVKGLVRLIEIICKYAGITE